MSRKGFTLLELVVVVIILGILATLGFTQYTKMVEKGRTAEAKVILGQMRTAQQGYLQQFGSFTSTVADLSVQVPTACAATHYFIYSTSAAIDATSTGTATRCTASGKAPQSATAYTLTLGYSTGDFGGSAGYY